jgi:hypothetical protein
VLNAYFIRNLDDALQGRIFSLVYMTPLVNAPTRKEVEGLQSALRKRIQYVKLLHRFFTHTMQLGL